MTETWVLMAGLAACFAAVPLTFVAVLRSQPGVSKDRRTPAGVAMPTSALAGPAQRLASTLGGWAGPARSAKLATALDLAGLALRPGDYLLIVSSSMLAALAVGLIVSGWILALILALAAPLVATKYLTFRSSRRRAAFADQLDDSLQLLAGNLRAGHSLLRAMDTVSREAEVPTSVEFGRVINETRVGRALGECLDDTAARMASQDFTWVAQAIAIHREVGGDLAEVLDSVSTTIRERNQIRRQVKALSAEGRMSGYVLMLLPVGITGFLMMSNPAYLTKLTQSLIGWGLIGNAVLMMIVGGLWLRKVVSFKF
jgi:tight adherence protein B